MAIDSGATTISSPQEQDEAASLLQRARNGVRKLRPQPLAEVDAALAQASVVVNKAYTSLWGRGQDILEQLAFSFFLAPIISFIYLIRLFVGNLQHGGFTISYRTFMVQAIPGLKIYEIRRHATAIIFLLLFIFQAMLVTVFIQASQDQILMAKIGMCVTFHVNCK